MSKLQLFLQYEGHRRIEVVHADEGWTVAQLLEAVKKAGLPADRGEGAFVFLHGQDDALAPDAILKVIGVQNKHRIHVHRCTKVEVTIHFNERTEKMHFPPSATVERVKEKFVKEIRMSPVDATEHVLQLCKSVDRPEPDEHIGSLVCGWR